ncbi:rod shape-determining protein RodA [Patescibacteria group bacterium]|nr:rod shape-determining protein RodA [Patescibacteria group bacterium]MBU4512868.1 rod shape-determining protein RodA [Patescibacteria group bacterium]MCG2693145.1 rod shape-determining protein RodA [Candidatus Parcubacteria bacterium]
MRLRNFTPLLKRIDWSLLVITMLLVFFGLAIQYSLGLNAEASDFSFFKKQLIALFIGMVIFCSFIFFDFRALRNYAYPLYGLGLLMLLAVLFFGETLRGTRGWFVLAGFSFQAVELVKLILVIVLANYWRKNIKDGRVAVKSVARSGVLVLAPAVLVLLQPDMGSVLLLFVLWFILFLIIDKQLPHILGVLFLLLLSGFMAWLFILAPYQKERVLTFLVPGRDPLGVGYQITQSIIAVGSGQFFGRGLGLGPQSQLHFLPDANTDFVFSVIAEEFGFIGICTLFTLYVLLLIRMIRILKTAYDDFSLFLVLGVIVLFSSQVFVNIGMNVGVLPVTGVPLPLVSYGGSFLIITLMSLGLLESVVIHGSQKRSSSVD